LAKKRTKGRHQDRREPRACDLVILADAPDTDIWLGNDHGHLIQRATGTLKASLVPGEYTVEFGLGSFPYPIRLEQSMEYRQSELVENYGNPGSQARG
jgi:hypothetical protein